MHGAVGVDDRAEGAGGDGMEDPADVLPEVRVEVLVAGPLLAGHQSCDRLAPHDAPQRLDGIADHAGVPPVAQEAVVDRRSDAEGRASGGRPARGSGA